MQNSQELKMEPILNSEEMSMIINDLGDVGHIYDLAPGNQMAQIQEDEFIPEAYDSIPSNENYDGNYGFEVFVPPSKNITYSQKLRKLYVKMSNDFTMEYKCTYPPGVEFFVRAKPRFCQPTEAMKPVKRCMQHAHDSSNTGYENYRHHVLRCKTTQAKYYGGSFEHCSVVAPLRGPEVGSDTVSLTYQFVCQNSCSGGMNRRAIEVIFTLEDAGGTVYGRSSIPVRVCSCPKRDKEKEEAEFRDQDAGAPPSGKKRKLTKRPAPAPLPMTQNDEIQPLTINVVGAERKAVLKLIYDLHAGALRRGVPNPHVYEECLEGLKRQENEGR